MAAILPSQKTFLRRQDTFVGKGGRHGQRFRL